MGFIFTPHLRPRCRLAIDSGWKVHPCQLFRKMEHGASKRAVQTVHLNLPIRHEEELKEQQSRGLFGFFSLLS